MDDEQTSEKDDTKPEPEALEEKPLSAEAEIEEAISKSKIKSKKDQEKKKRFKLYSALGVVAFLGAGIYWLMQPYTATMAYGVCRIFVELNTRYPQTLKFSTVETLDNGMSVRIWYTQIDSFGEYRLEPIQCFFRQDEKLGFVVDKITIKRREVQQAQIDEFNKILPVVLQSGVDLTYPAPLPDSLEDLQFETDRFRKPIL